MRSFNPLQMELLISSWYSILSGSPSESESSEMMSGRVSSSESGSLLGSVPGLLGSMGLGSVPSIASETPSWSVSSE